MGAGEAKALYDRVREAVHRRWDPIGVAAYSEEMGEYDSYIPALCRLLENHASSEQIFKYLWTMETESIGLSGNRPSTEAFSIWLYNLAELNK